MRLNIFEKLKQDPYYWGMDVTQYPGDETMAAWKNDLPLQFTGFYLAPSPGQSNTSWMNKRGILSEQGWGFAPVYMGQQSGSGNLTTGQGALDAQNAAVLARKAGFRQGTYIYLDIQELGAISDAFLSYINGFVKRLLSAGYSPAVYCNYKNADKINSFVSGNPRFWVANYTYAASGAATGKAPDPANSGVPFAAVWQLAEDIPITFGGHRIASVDINSSIYRDPSI